MDSEESNDQVDLTLTLGLPQHDNRIHREENAGRVPMPPPHINLNLRGPSIQAANGYGPAIGGRIVEDWGKDSNKFPFSAHMATHYMNSNGLGHYSVSSMELPRWTDSYNIIIPHQAATLQPMNNSAVIDGPQGMLESEPKGSSSVSRRRYAYRHRAHTIPLDTERRCSNPHCNTNDTPMWRKGPLGPKTLCNACGIKYRKSEEKKRGKGVAEPSGHGDQV